jgi:CHAT domain-containing protein
MDETFLGQLISVGSKKGEKGIRQLLTQHPEQLTADNALACRRLAINYRTSGNSPGAYSLFIISAEMYTLLGDHIGALSDKLTALEVQSWGIQSVSRLKNNAAVAKIYQEIADKLGRRNLSSWAALLHAECLLFAMTYSEEGESTASVAESIEAIVGFFTTLEGPVPPEISSRVTDLVAAVASRIPSDSDAVATKRLIEGKVDLAMGIVQFLPDPVPFPDDPERGCGAAEVVARFLDEVGPFGSANRHWQYAMQGARDAAATSWLLRLCQDCIQVLSNRYATEEASGEATARELALCRGHLRGRLELSRGFIRSRAGRRWLATRYNHLRGAIIKDDQRALEKTEEGDFRKRYTAEAVPVKVAPAGPFDPIAIMPISADALFAAAEGAKARLLLDLIEAEPPPSNNLSPHARVDTYERKLLQLPETARQSQKDDPLWREMNLCSLFVGPSDITDRAPLSERLVELEAILHSGEVGLNSASAPKTLTEVIDTLAEDELLIDYIIPSRAFHPAHRLYILALSKEHGPLLHRSLSYEKLDKSKNDFIGDIQMVLSDTREVIMPLIQMSWLITKVASTRLAIQREDPNADALLRGFYELLLRPVADAGLLNGVRKLVIVPHGPLHYLPFSALRQPDGRYLAQDYSTAQLPSASVWTALSGRKKTKVESFTGFANPALSRQDLKQLKESVRELGAAERALSQLDLAIFKEDEATEETALKSLTGRSILHFSTHGEFDEHDADDGHRILLTPSGDHDGNLEAREIRDLDLSASQLVVLSICRGGLFRFAPGDEPLGLMPSFLVAGARSVVAPLWAADDGPTRWFFTDFYRHLMEHGPGESLRRAQIRFIEEERSLRHWSGFVLVGPSGWGGE